MTNPTLICAALAKPPFEGVGHHMASCFDTDGEDDALGLPAARTTDETEPAGGADVEEPTARKNEEGNGEGNGEEERGGLQLRPRVALQYHRPDG